MGSKEWGRGGRECRTRALGRGEINQKGSKKGKTHVGRDFQLKGRQTKRGVLGAGKKTGCEPRSGLLNSRRLNNIEEKSLEENSVKVFVHKKVGKMS